MKKKTVITTETREMWVIRRASWDAEKPAPEERKIESPKQLPTIHTDHDAKKDNDSSAESTMRDVQE